MIEWTLIRKGLIALLARKGAMTREKIEGLTNLPRTTIYDNLVVLEKELLVKRYNDASHNNRGRPQVYWKLNIKDEVMLEK